MSLLDGFLTAFKAISANGLRSFLTMLGLLIGVGSVIVLISIGQGTQAGIKEEITNLGTDLLFISPGSSSESGVRGRRGSARTLFAEDVIAIREANLPGVEAAAPQLNIGNAQAIVGSLNQEIDLVGTDSDYLNVRNLTLSEGSFISSKDISSGSLYMVLGSNIATALFPEENAIGKTIRTSFFNGRISFNFKVIGVLLPTGGESVQDDYVFIPVSSAQKRLKGLQNISGKTIINQITIKTSPNIDQEKVSEFITEFLKRHHQVDEPDFTVTSQTQLLETVNEIGTTISLLLGSIAGISLFVGGIGVMNIMLVSVTERTREIGIRRAIGATGPDIALQFLIEALALSILGGIAGILLGITGSTLLNGYEIADTPLITIITPWSIILAFTVASVVGIVSGLYPAWRASLLDPITALRNQ